MTIYSVCCNILSSISLLHTLYILYNSPYITAKVLNFLKLSLSSVLLTTLLCIIMSESHPYSVVTVSVSRFMVRNVVIFDFVAQF